MEILGFIPARGASQGIPHKNKRLFLGRPLVQWTIDTALASRCTRVVVSTADKEIGGIAERSGAEWIRRPTWIDSLGDINATEAHLRGYLRGEATQPNYILRLQPTSPLRTVIDIETGIRLMLDHEGATVGVCETREHPNIQLWADTRQRVATEGWERPRQEYRKAVWVNGAFYGAPWAYFDRHGFGGPNIRLYEMPRERSVDLDTDRDWLIAETIGRLALEPEVPTWG